jgi:hypothetical protein
MKRWIRASMPGPGVSYYRALTVAGVELEYSIAFSRNL